jgi:hypothetical protein
MTSEERRPVPASSAILALLVGRATTSFEVLAHSRSLRLPGGVRLKAPSLSGPGASDLPDDASEIVAEVIGVKGAVLDAYAWGGVSRDFADTVGGDGETWRGFSLKSEDLPRRLFIPIRRAGRFLVVSRSSFAGTGASRTEQREPLAAFRLGGDGGGPPASVLPASLQSLLARPGFRDLGFRPGFDSFSMIEGSLAAEQRPPKPCGSIESVSSLHPVKRRGDNRFDIVVTGDGFAKDDIGRFKSHADALIEGLRGRSPFREFDESINYHTVVAISDESGITDPIGDGGPKRTYYHSTTGFANSHARHVIGTNHPQLVHEAASLVRPWSEIEIVFVIANLGIYGGYAMRRHGVAYISKGRYDPVETLIRLAAHEGGHVIAKLADEYISCDRYDPRDDRPNVATERQVAERRVPWQHMAEAADLTPNGGFRVVHRYGDPMNRKTGEPELPDDQLNRLGAFWGCMYTSPPAPDVDAPCAVFDDDRGKGFYRPMARCLMRRRAYGEYCAPCARAVAEAIREKTSVPRASRRPPGDSPRQTLPIAARKK